MRLLLTGGTGFLGHNALLTLPRSWEVVALYRPQRTSFPAFLDAHGLSYVRAVPCDLTDAAQVERALKEVGREFDICLYLASNTWIPGSIQQPVEDLTTNTISLLNTLGASQINHLVYFSSGAVYIGIHGMVGPNTFVTPTLPYAVSKLASEHYIRAFARYRGTPSRSTIVRFYGAYGPYEPARKIYTALVRRFAFERNPQFTVRGDGENYIDAMYVDDTMRAIHAVLASPPTEGVECIDLGVGRGETINELVTRAAHLFGLEPEITHVDDSPEYITFRCDPRPFATRYSFTPEIPLEDGLQRLANHLAERHVE
jgi:nucleoside-diphosphate-sugar epimerase